MGLVNVEAALQMLEQALPAFGSGTPEGESVLKAMTTLSKIVNRQQAQGLIPAQIMELARAQQESPLGQMMGGQQSAPPPA